MKVSLFSLVAFVLLLAGSCTTKKDVGIKIHVLLSTVMRMLSKL